ncbi:MAG: WhiB family transcriptional regulator [Dermatophilaceae bacterium]|nr:WhiB family transcriptional regulator [Intrasporangiaceae bacterium]
MDAVDWREHAGCRGDNTEFFFSSAGESVAKEICSVCVVQEACLAYALRTKQENGVWGGLTSEERHDRLRAATPGGPPLLTIEYTTRARSTGSLCSAGRTEEGWGVTCVTHGSRARARNRTDAGYAASRPEEWCPQCR